jgi:hypothetical protein
MPELTIASTTVPSWSPRFHISDQARDIFVWDNASPGETLTVDHFSGSYEAPEIVFTELGNTTVAGNSFCVKSATLGVLRESITLINRAGWAEAIPPGDKLVQVDNSEPALVVGNLAQNNYYHWTLQCFASFLVYRRLIGSDDFAAIMPELNSFQSRLLSIADFFGRCFEITTDEVILASHGVYGNLCGGAFAFAPHPAVLAEFETFAAGVKARRRFNPRIYISRRDAGQKRGIVNEDAVCELMERHGFEIITPGDMSVEEQIAAFRNAEIIVGPHGAGLANLVYCRSGGGTRVIELAQMSYVAGFFVRICQAKQLDYTGLVNPNVATPKEANQPADRHNINDISSMIDIKLLESVIEKL